LRSILIVDDDAIICRGLKEGIDWSEYGYKVMGSASDGEKAFDMIKRNTPDIVITDIKMPFMDGLELTKAIKTEYPLIKVILLTGYEDFEFARKALNLKAFEYILKPVDNEVLIRTVLRAAEELESETVTRKQIEKSLLLLQRNYMRKLVAGTIRDEDMASEMRSHKISLADGFFVVLLIKWDQYDAPRLPELVEPGSSCILGGTLHEGYHGVSVDMGENEVVVVYNEIDLDCGKSETVNKAVRLAYRMKEEIGSRFGSTVSIGIGSVYDKIGDINKSYNEACTAIEFRHLHGGNRVYCIEDTGFPPDSANILIDGRMKELSQTVKLGMKDEAVRIVESIKSDILSNKVISIKHIGLIGIEMLIAAGIDDTNKYEVFRKIQDMQTMDGIFGEIIAFVASASETIHSRREDQQGKIVEAAKQYIESNFAKSDLSLTEIAMHLHVSAVYLSSIFKQKLHVNYSDYLLTVRMEKAMELLRNTDLKIYEVSERTGYNNAHYFSSCFKKFTDYTPVEFKQK